VNAGKRRKLLTVQSRDSGTDAAGQPVSTWTQVGQVFADVRAQTGLGTIRGTFEGVAADVNAYSFRISFTRSFDAGMRVLLDGEAFDITAVRHDLAGRKWTDLVCTLGGNDG
jgi:SPP1 family predicted phage head-tail adaptor